ncbi:hypothetical protein QQG55_16185 [Brugia pahangi]
MFTISIQIITVVTILTFPAISGNALSRGSKVKEPKEPGFCLGAFNFCAEGYTCKKIKCVEEEGQKIKGKSIGPCLRGLCPSNSICYPRNNRCYLTE